jgi:predicted Zn-dependent protease
MKDDNAPSLDLQFAFLEDDYYRLWRAHHAAALLATLSGDLATRNGISHDSTAAVADYIQQELQEVLGSATQIPLPRADIGDQYPPDMV